MNVGPQKGPAAIDALRPSLFIKSQQSHELHIASQTSLTQKRIGRQMTEAHVKDLVSLQVRSTCFRDVIQLRHRRQLDGFARFIGIQPGHNCKEQQKTDHTETAGRSY